MKIKSKRPARLSLLLLVLAAPLLAGNVVRAGSTREPQNLDPARVWDDTSSFYVLNIFDTLVRLDPGTMKIVPSLAVSWETSPDGRTWTFHLRRGVRFHDGSTCDADAVVFSFARQLHPASPDRNGDFPLFFEIFTYLKAVRKVSPYQVQFILSEPFFPFLASLTVDCAAIVSPAAVKKYGAAFTTHPVGTGPYKLQAWQRNKRLVLAANADYWRGKPAIDEYVDTIEPQAELLSKHFQDGQMDILSTYSISKMVSYKKQDWVQVAASPLYSVTYVVFNASRPALKSRNVRRALCHAWDPRALKLVFQDYVLPIHSLLPPGLAGIGPAAPPLEFSLAKAQTLLKKERGAAEIQLELLLLRDDGLLYQLLSMYARNLKQAGVRLKFNRLDSEEYARRVAAGDYDLAYSGWIADYPDADSMLFPQLSDKLRQQGFANIAASGRQDLLQRLILARREGDAGKRQDAYREIDRAFIGDGLVLPLYQDKRVVIFNRKLRNIQPNPLGKLSLYELRIK
jgi:peptide/nickel transport system substrate-binding protein